MSKELTHRAEELKDLGWSEHDLARYIELWDYRQRWGAINLERDDRQFLRKAEAALPEIKTLKSSVKKPIKEKSYYCRLVFFLEEMAKAETSFDSKPSSKGLWPILLEEELRLLDYFQPVLGLPDTLKSKALIPFRENIISSLIEKHKENIQTFDFDFNSSLETYNSSENKNWKPLRDGITKDLTVYAIVDQAHISDCRNLIRQKLIPTIRDCFPSLVDMDKSNPSDDWIPESQS
ncbi:MULTISPECIES: hypothetical protein [Prochlorococcus]|uniref:Uncharacterized protein n=1 Tax=Prochlorococcus marinus (strain SARG / CCMP1375 / SS120) TaxID=167539 RepID=Q7VCE1_PROMA|nr:MULTISPECIES: hypothetical protein [Prochlorococcus]AAP99843.1 Predicted protein [Prochlorococcus marinus subsp. marinus str. CCMP1375]KGG11810.1 hypothetical protein EV04_0835 [Prochlorococcus marinus str. LG]KGG21883.1 hypothetical protein EV08_0488 [Prochlorococcus marinus str. SS2]KGG23686.1 hypothetical protein EV09_1311 [Prochlorococcus marinus str. SS35]KGG32078.1 hypothetical protein EV10_1192 [Prochlorococcus marinus str. SS51]